MRSIIHRSLRAATAACALLLAAACAAAPPAADAPPVDASTRLQPMTWTAESPAGEIAEWAYRGCRRAPGGKIPCLERTLVALIDQTGIAKSMAVLEALAPMDAEVRDNGHPLAHGLGISAYRGQQTMAATFAACPTSQMSGCPHGVIQGYFLDLAGQGRQIGAAELDALCAPHRGLQFIFFQCGHGMGHGLMAVHQNYLPMALESCDLVTEAFIRESCYGGVFMENVMHVTHPHQTAGGHAVTQGGGHGGGHAPADAHAAHASAPADPHAAHGGQHAAGGHAGHAAAPAMAHGEWKGLDRDDPLFPCNAVAEKYHDECYGMQTSAILFFNNGDVAATARLCDTAPEASRPRCFMSLGRDVAALAGQQHGRMIDLCQRSGGTAGGQGKVWCVRGAVETLVNQSADPQDGIRFCRAVEGEETKADCYRAVGGFMQALLPAGEPRARQCASAEPDFVAVCRRGAGIDPTSGQD
jgi:hypothetical protein